MSTDRALLKEPSAYLPLAMSFASLAIVLGYLALHGPAPQKDEGAAARIWQVLMAGQVPLVLYFGFRWLPKAPRQAVPIIAAQIVAAIAATAPVLILGW